MRRAFIISVILFFFCSIFAYAQFKQPTLVGTWRYFYIETSDNGSSRLEPGPYFKKIAENGNFYNLIYMNGNYQFTHQGAYYLIDDIYKEYMTKHAGDKNMIGVTSKIHYYFINENMVNFSFKYKNKDCFEVWVRVPDNIDLSSVVAPEGY